MYGKDKIPVDTYLTIFSGVKQVSNTKGETEMYIVERKPGTKNNTQV